MPQLQEFARWIFALPETDTGSVSTVPFVDIDQMLVRRDRRLVTALLVFLMVPIFWSVGLELVEYANDWPRLRARLVLRGLAILVPAGGLIAVRSAHTRKAYSRAVLCVALALVLNLANNLLRLQGSILPMRAVFLFLIVMYGALPNSFARQIVPPLVYTAGVIGERAFWVNSDAAGDLPTDVLILLFVNAIGMVMVHRRVTLEREIAVRFLAEQKSLRAVQQALADLQVLCGIIPICSHCRRVRTEVGDWLQLERYVADHTQADFSQGICPTCMLQHYPPGKPAQN